MVCQQVSSKSRQSVASQRCLPLNQGTREGSTFSSFTSTSINRGYLDLVEGKYPSSIIIRKQAFRLLKRVAPQSALGCTKNHLKCHLAMTSRAECLKEQTSKQKATHPVADMSNAHINVVPPWNNKYFVVYIHG